jgi:hypothetical protein
MTKLKDMMMRGMSKIMLDCDTATLLITKGEFEQLGWLDKIRLKMHLPSCKFCRNFSEQSKYITTQLNEMKSIDPKKLKLHLTDEQKSRLNKTLKEQSFKNN